MHPYPSILPPWFLEVCAASRSTMNINIEFSNIYMKCDAEKMAIFSKTNVTLEVRQA
jgi:hypothetical protein